MTSEDVKDCADAVKQDNDDLSKSSALAICQDMANEGDL